MTTLSRLSTRRRIVTYLAFAGSAKEGVIAADLGLSCDRVLASLRRKSNAHLFRSTPRGWQLVPRDERGMSKEDYEIEEAHAIGAVTPAEIRRGMSEVQKNGFIDGQTKRFVKPWSEEIYLKRSRGKSHKEDEERDKAGIVLTPISIVGEMPRQRVASMNLG